MIEPAVPVDESERVALLRDMAILDTPPEERFDRVTRLAAALFDVPIALVSLLDTNRQWFKSRHGLDVSETSRAVSFCGHAILRPETLIVPDAAGDTRFADNPLVKNAPGIRFYAGRPIAMPGGQRLGTLCLIDRRPRTFDARCVAQLDDLASIVEDLFAAFELATTDSATGLANWRGFERIASNALENARRHRQQACVMTFGLEEASAPHVRTFADAAQRVFRKSDVVARRAGGRFCAFLTAVGPSIAPNLLHRLNLDLRAGSPPSKSPPAFAHGIAFRGREDDADLATLVERAEIDLANRAAGASSCSA